MEFQDPPDPGLPQYKTLKTSLASVIKLKSKQGTITAAVCTVDKIISRSLFFLKLYLIHHVNDSPKVDLELVDTIFKTVCQQTAIGRPPSAKMQALRNKLTTFYNEHFVPLLPPGDTAISYKYLSTVLDYAAVQVVTVFETNVKAHYVEYVESYVNTAWQKRDLEERIRRIRKTKREREASLRKLARTLRDIKNDLLSVGKEPFKSHVSYHKWMRDNKKLVLPARVRFEKDLIYYDIQCKPQDYYPAMLKMTAYVEQAGRRPRSFCPLRTSLIPKHIYLRYDDSRTSVVGSKREIQALDSRRTRQEQINDMGDILPNQQERVQPQTLSIQLYDRYRRRISFFAVHTKRSIWQKDTQKEADSQPRTVHRRINRSRKKRSRQTKSHRY